MVRLTTRSSQLTAPDVVCAALTKMTTTSYSGPYHILLGDHQKHQDSRMARFNASTDPWSLADRLEAPRLDDGRSEGERVPVIGYSSPLD